MHIVLIVILGLFLVSFLSLLYIFLARKWFCVNIPRPIVFFPQKDSFNYKIRQHMRKDHPKIFTLMADKYAVREYVKKKIPDINLPKLYVVTDDPETIDFTQLPNKYVVKANHGSGWIMIIHNGIDIITNKEYTQKEIVEKCKKWLSKTYGKFIIFNEPHYWDIEPKIIIEEFIEPMKNHQVVPVDYKFYVYHGRAEYLEVHTKRYINHIQNIYTRDWEKLNVIIGEPISDDFDPKPENFDTLMTWAEKLGEDVDFVRVDLYTVDDKIYFGELTLTPGTGIAKFVPAEYDLIFGKHW